MYNFVLLFSVPPKIKQDDVSERNLTVIAQRPIVIDCPAEGVPPPDIIWYKVSI